MDFEQNSARMDMNIKQAVRGLCDLSLFSRDNNQSTREPSSPKQIRRGRKQCNPRKRLVVEPRNASIQPSDQSGNSGRKNEKGDEFLSNHIIIEDQENLGIVKYVCDEFQLIKDYNSMNSNASGSTKQVPEIPEEVEKVEKVVRKPKVKRKEAPKKKDTTEIGRTRRARKRKEEVSTCCICSLEIPPRMLQSHVQECMMALEAEERMFKTKEEVSKKKANKNTRNARATKRNKRRRISEADDEMDLLYEDQPYNPRSESGSSTTIQKTVRKRVDPDYANFGLADDHDYTAFSDNQKGHH